MGYCVGLTGGIASGKSSVARLFKELHIDVIDADQIAKALTQKEEAAYNAIIEHFGSAILDEEGNLSRKTLRRIIFADDQERLWLETLLHPLIRQRIKEQVQQSQNVYCVIEIPLLLDKNNYPYLNRILLIEAPKELQLQRLKQRDHSSEQEALTIIKAQPSPTLRRQYADDILVNSGTFKELKNKVLHLHQHYLSLSAKENSQS